MSVWWLLRVFVWLGGFPAKMATLFDRCPLVSDCVAWLSWRFPFFSLVFALGCFMIPSFALQIISS